MRTKRKTITRSELTRLAFCNSDKLPHVVVMLKPRRMEWVGIGWIDVGPPVGNEVVMIEDLERPKSKRGTNQQHGKRRTTDNTADDGRDDRHA